MISYNSVMSIDGFNDSFYWTIGGFDSFGGDDDYSSVDSDIAGGNIIGRDDNDGRKEEERR